MTGNGFLEGKLNLVTEHLRIQEAAVLSSACRRVLINKQRLVLITPQHIDKGPL